MVDSPAGLEARVLRRAAVIVHGTRACIAPIVPIALWSCIVDAAPAVSSPASFMAPAAPSAGSTPASIFRLLNLVMTKTRLWHA